MCVPVFPHKIGFAGVEVDAVDAEVLGAQCTDHLLDTDAGVVEFKAFPQDIVDILNIQEDKAVSAGGGGIRYDLHQIPAEVLAGTPAVAAGPDIQTGFHGLFEMVRTGERDKIVHIVRMNISVVDKLAEPARESVRTVADGPVLRTDLHDLILIFRQVHPQNLVISVTDHLDMGRHGDDKGRDLLFPERADGRDIDHLAERSIVAERLMLLTDADGQKRAVYTGVVSHFMAGHSQTDMRGDFPDPPIVIQYLMIIFTDDENTGRRYRV